MERYSSLGSSFTTLESDAPPDGMCVNSCGAKNESSGSDTIEIKLCAKETNVVSTVGTGVDDLYKSLLSQILSKPLSLDLQSDTDSRVGFSDTTGGETGNTKGVKLDDSVLESLSKRIRDMINEELSRNRTESNRSDTPLPEYVLIPEGECIRLAIEGNIGAGKSELMTVLTEIMKELIVGPGKVGILEEPVDIWVKFVHAGDQGSPDLLGKGLLELSYLKPKIYAGLFQWTAFMSRALLSVKVLPGACLSLSERSLLSDRAFEKNSVKEGNIDALGDNIYDYLTEGAMKFLEAKPQGLIYVKTDPVICSERIEKRNRTGEGSIPITYLKNLHERHEKWLQPHEGTFFLDGKLTPNKIFNNTDHNHTFLHSNTTTNTSGSKNLSSVIVPKEPGDTHNLPRIIIDGDLDSNMRDSHWREDLKQRVHELLIVCASHSGMLSDDKCHNRAHSTNTSRIYRNYASYSSISESN